MKISVIIKEPDKKPRHVNIENTLENFQRTVGGYIEVVNLIPHLVAICNEEGRIEDLPHSCTIMGIDFCGTVILAGTSGEDFADIPITFAEAKKLIGE